MHLGFPGWFTAARNDLDLEVSFYRSTYLVDDHVVKPWATLEYLQDILFAQEAQMSPSPCRQHACCSLVDAFSAENGKFGDPASDWAGHGAAGTEDFPHFSLGALLPFSNFVLLQ